MNFDPEMFGSGLGSFLGGIFGNSGKPYDKAMDQYREYANKSQGLQQPYIDAGQSGLGNYQEWLQGQKDPTQFVNKLMGDYKESPYSQYLQQQSLRAGQNAASASGLSGSTPLMEQLQQNAGNIASQDQNQWLQHVLGINTQYGQGQNNLINSGQNSANKLTDTYNNLGKEMGEAAWGKERGKQKDWWNTIGGAIGTIGSFF